MSRLDSIQFSFELCITQQIERDAAAHAEEAICYQSIRVPSSACVAPVIRVHIDPALFFFCSQFLPIFMLVRLVVSSLGVASVATRSFVYQQCYIFLFPWDLYLLQLPAVCISGPHLAHQLMNGWLLSVFVSFLIFLRFCSPVFPLIIMILLLGTFFFCRYFFSPAL